MGQGQQILIMYKQVKQISQDMDDESQSVRTGR